MGPKSSANDAHEVNDPANDKDWDITEHALNSQK